MTKKTKNTVSGVKMKEKLISPLRAIDLDSRAASTDPSIIAFDDFFKKYVGKLSCAAAKIGGQVKDVTDVLSDSFLVQKMLLIKIKQTKKPDMVGLGKFLEPLNRKLIEAINMTEGRLSDFSNHVNAVAKSLQALAWIETQTPMERVEESWQEAEIYNRKVLVEYTNKDANHVEWARALEELYVSGIRYYIKSHYPAGPVWSDTGSTGPDLDHLFKPERFELPAWLRESVARANEFPLSLSNDGMNSKDWSMLRHAYSDLINVDPLVFLYLTKECYVRGKGNERRKVYILRQQVLPALHTKPEPALFVARCLYILPFFEPYSEGLSDLMLTALNLFLKMETKKPDLREAQFLAIQSFRIILSGTEIKDPRILLKIPEVYSIKPRDLKEALLQSDEEASVEPFVSQLLEIQSYMTVVSLLEYFNIRHSEGSFTNEMLKKDEFKAAEKWVNFIGKPHELIIEYVKRGMVKEAADLVDAFKLRAEFPEVYRVITERQIKRLADKGLWDVAERKAHHDKQLLQFLVDMAMRAGETTLANELCAKYPSRSLEAKEALATLPKIPYLLVKDLGIVIKWVSGRDDLLAATTYIESRTIVGLDVEWRPNYIKGQNNKASILQIASEEKAFIFDLITLCRDHSDLLNECLIRIFRSHKILKLGYDCSHDMTLLAQSYGELDCFKHLKRVLDLKRVYKKIDGGLQGLTKEVLGVVLNKNKRMSNWEERPLSKDQLDYAALDAAVLVRIFRHVEQNKMEWESHIISYGGETLQR